MGLVHPAEEIVQVAHDVLVGAGEEDPEIIGLAVQVMERQGVHPFLVEIDEFGDLAVGIAGDVGQGSPPLGLLVQPVQGHDRKELAVAPMVEQGLEDAEVAEILVGKLALQLDDIVGLVLGILEMLQHPGAGEPEKLLHLRLDLQADETQLEMDLGLLLVVQGVVVRLQRIAGVDVGVVVPGLFHQFMTDPRFGGILGMLHLLDVAEGFHHQHRMMRHHGPPRLADDHRVFDPLGIADIHDVVDDVPGVFVQGIVDGGMEGGAAAVVVHP